MTPDAFIDAIIASPADEALRLVYADWLDERGDPRGRYLRTEITFAGTNDAKARRELETLLGQIVPVCEADDADSVDAFVFLLTQLCDRPEGAEGE